jgi:hypothetical protein
MGALIIGLGFLFSIPFLIIYGTWAWAVVLKSVWLWFVVPAFALQPLTFTQAVAVSALVNIFFIKSHIAATKHDDKKLDEVDFSPIINGILTAALAPWVTWIIYWFVQAIFV